MRHVLAILTIISLATIGCMDSRQPANSQRPSPSASAPQHSPKPPPQPIPDDVSYSVIGSDVLPGRKRRLDIRLNKRVSEETLRTIALDLKSQDSRDYDRTYMAYYLPDMIVDAGAWATTHFKPNLEVRILGLTSEEVEEIVAEPAPANWEVLGRWLDGSSFAGGRITIFREDGELFIEEKFKDGSSLNKELIEKKSRLGRRFDPIEGFGNGDYWVLDASGDLQIRDNDGLNVTAKRIPQGGG